MSDLYQLTLGPFLFISLVIIALFAMNRRMKRACEFVIEDLQARMATGPESAVSLPYLKRGFITFGMRDYRPRALQTLMENGAVSRTEDDRFYLSRSIGLR
jgi:hypothetical protein